VTVGSIKALPEGRQVLAQVSLKKHTFPKQKKTVRAVINISGTLLTPLGPNKTEMIQCARSTLMMTVPGWLQKFVIKG